MERSRNLGKSIVVAAILCGAVFQVRADDWLPVDEADLKMTREPNAPGAAAVILYRQVDRDDNVPAETVYLRLKILTDEGRKYADVEIPFNKSTEYIRGIQARTIRPDGSIINFDGTVFEKQIVQGRGVKLLAKTFTMPDVQAGSIVEYRYRHVLPAGYVFDSHWILSQELFTKRAKFSLVQYWAYAIRYSWPMGLPTGTDPPKGEHGRVRLETHDVPAFATEEYMPPADELKYRVDFIYLSDTYNEKDPAAFWKKYGKQRYHDVEAFVDKRRAMEQAVAQIVAPGDSPETKLKKIYERTEKIRNLSFERAKTEEEQKREGQKDAHTVADVWSRGYGDAFDVTWLFLGLARAAGFQADAVLVPSRDRHFLNEHAMNPSQLNSNLVVVKLDGKDLFLDPGVPYTPFGALPWGETAVKGLRLDKNGGTWITTPVPSPMDARIERKAELTLTPSGSLEGKLTVTYTGIEAAWRRVAERNDDDTDRKTYLEDEVKWDVPSGIDVSLTNSPVWDAADEKLVAEFDLKVPGWAANAGQRELLPVGVFTRREKHIFEHAARVHPLYFNFPSKITDDVTIALPAGWSVSSVPELHSADLKVVSYKTSTEKREGSLHIARELTLNALLIQSKYYAELRDFYQTVRTHDEEQAVVAPNKVQVSTKSPPAKTPTSTKSGAGN